MKKFAVALVAALLVCAPAFAASKKKEPEKKDPAAEINTPRQDARKVSFETSEGTWISVDVSPDNLARLRLQAASQWTWSRDSTEQSRAPALSTVGRGRPTASGLPN